MNKEYFYFRHSINPETKYLAKLNQETGAYDVYDVHDGNKTFLKSFTPDEVVQKIGTDWVLIAE